MGVRFVLTPIGSQFAFAAPDAALKRLIHAVIGVCKHLQGITDDPSSHEMPRLGDAISLGHPAVAHAVVDAAFDDLRAAPLRVLSQVDDALSRQEIAAVRRRFAEPLFGIGGDFIGLLRRGVREQDPEHGYQFLTICGR